MLASAETEDAARLAGVEAAAPMEGGVPEELVDALREAQRNAVPTIPSLRRRKEAALLMEVERRFQVFDDLLKRASRVLVPCCGTLMTAREGMVDAPPEPLQTVAETVRSTPRCDTGGLHDEMVLCELLVRLPAQSVHRCRAVCRSWRRLTSDPAFLLAHHRRQPALPLIYFSRGNSDCIGAINLQAAQLRPVVRYTWPFGYNVNASCDGLLLLSSPGRFYICNPATNQWAAVPQLLGVDFLGLYPHHPSGEYRLLYGELRGDVESVYNILAVGSSEPRRITMTMGSEPAEEPLAREFLMHARGGHSVLVRRNLHWYLRNRNDSDKIMVFDTVAESFQWMRPPVAPGWVVLFEMDGTLGMSASGAMARIDLWVLQDYERNVWAFKYRIELPMEQIRQFPECGVEHAGWFAIVVSGDGDVLVRCSNRVFHCDRKGNVLVTFQFDGRLPMNCLHRLKESLVLHAFFQMQHNNGVGLPPLF